MATQAPAAPSSGVFSKKLDDLSVVYYYISNKVLYKRVDAGVFTSLGTLSASAGTMTIYPERTQIAIAGNGVLSICMSTLVAGELGIELYVVNNSGAITYSSILEVHNAAHSASRGGYLVHYAADGFHVLYDATFRSMGADVFAIQHVSLSQAGVLSSATIIRQLATQGIAVGAMVHVPEEDKLIYSTSSNVMYLIPVATLVESAYPSNFANYLFSTIDGYTELYATVETAGVNKATYAIELFSQSLRVAACDFSNISTPAAYIAGDLGNISGWDIRSGGCWISADETELYISISLRSKVSTDHKRVLYSLDISGAWATTGRALNLIADEPLIPSMEGASTINFYQGTFGTALSTSTTPVEIFWRVGTLQLWYETWTHSLLAGGAEITAAVILPAIAPAASLFSYTPDRDISINLMLPSVIPSITQAVLSVLDTQFLQLTHSLEKYEFSGGDVRYVLRVGGNDIPMVNFTLSKAVDIDGLVIIKNRISVPVGFYDAISNAVNTIISLYRIVFGVEQLLSSTELVEVSTPEGVETITLHSEVKVSPLNSATVIPVSSQIYERNQGGLKAIRIGASINISTGDIVVYGAHEAEMIVAKLSTFISLEQQFTELTE